MAITDIPTLIIAILSFAFFIFIIFDYNTPEK